MDGMGGGTMRRAMYDRKSQFIRASKEGDHDLGTFGQCVKSVQLNGTADRLLYRCWHLRDCAWCEDENGIIDTLHRKWKPTADMLRRLFRDKVHPKVVEKLIGPNKDPYCEINCRHIVMPAEQFDGEYLGKGKRNVRFVSIYLDVDNKHIMEAVGQTYFMYVVPRWQTVSGSQYAYSPAAIAALPDARLIQAMTLTLLEAGRRRPIRRWWRFRRRSGPTSPSMRAGLLGSMPNMTSAWGGASAAHAGQVRPAARDGHAARHRIDHFRGVLPQQAVSAASDGRAGDHRLRSRATGAGLYPQAAPLFEPLEHEDNGAICETTFELMLSAGAFGSLDDVPQSLRGEDITFRFESPLHDAIERQKGQKYMEARALLAETLPLDPTARAHLDFTTAFRDTLMSIGVPAKWVKSESDAAEAIKAQEEQQKAAELLQTMQAGGQVAEQIGKAGQALGGQPLPAGGSMAAPA
jgi:hypothetical protein